MPKIMEKQNYYFKIVKQQLLIYCLIDLVHLLEIKEMQVKKKESRKK